LELRPDDPESGLDVDLEELQQAAVAEVDERQLGLAAVQRTRDVDRGHGTSGPQRRAVGPLMRSSGAWVQRGMRPTGRTFGRAPPVRRRGVGGSGVTPSWDTPIMSAT